MHSWQRTGHALMHKIRKTCKKKTHIFVARRRGAKFWRGAAPRFDVTTLEVHPRGSFEHAGPEYHNVAFSRYPKLFIARRRGATFWRGAAPRFDVTTLEVYPRGSFEHAGPEYHYRYIPLHEPACLYIPVFFSRSARSALRAREKITGIYRHAKYDPDKVQNACVLTLNSDSYVFSVVQIPPWRSLSENFKLTPRDLGKFRENANVHEFRVRSATGNNQWCHQASEPSPVDPLGSNCPLASQL